MTKLTADQKLIGKAWMHDILMIGGLIPPEKCARPGGYSLMYGYTGWNKADLQKAAKEVCDEILHRPCKLNALDDAFDTLSNFYFNKDIKSNSNYGSNKIRKPASMLAKYVADFCATNGFYWDDTNKTQYEMDAYRKSLLGAALYDYGCFLSQRNKPTATKTRTVSTSTSGEPVSDYKSTGGRSGDIPNLIGTPGEKIILTGYVFCVFADKIGRNTPGAFITPLQVVGDRVSKVSKANAERVKFSSANGYTDCKLWFDTQTTATEVLTKCEARFGTKFSHYQIGKKSADKNGYFKVSTEFGEAYIKAGKLNEELEEALANRPLPKLGTLDAEAFYKERD